MADPTGGIGGLSWGEATRIFFDAALLAIAWIVRTIKGAVRQAMQKAENAEAKAIRAEARANEIATAVERHKLEISKEYASISYLQDVDQRINVRLDRIEGLLIEELRGRRGEH